MSEFSISKKAGFSCVSHFFHFCFFLLSHPLYLSYLIFFFPYLLRLLSFLSPLFITTFLLLFAFLTLSTPSLLFQNRFSSDQSAESNMGFLATTYQVVFDSLQPRTVDETEEFRPMEELEAYKIVFETYTFGTGDNPYDGGGGDVPEVEVKVDCEDPVKSFPEKIKTFPEKREPENPRPCEKSRENEENEENEEREVNVVEKREEGVKENEDSSVRSESKAMEKETKDYRKLTEDSSISSISSRSDSSPWSSPGSFSREYSLGSYGSMRKEKEWRRTLACKLFEERHNAGGSEGMDSLWETYEKSETKKLQKKPPSSKAKRGKKMAEEKDEEDDDEEEEDRNGQLCCLQALKFSAGKMNLGMRRPNLVKMSKALKGFGWLSRHGSRKGLIY